MSSQESESSRREFLIQGTQAAAGIVAAGALASSAASRTLPIVQSRVIGANDRINMAVIGIRSRGMQLAKGFAKIPNVHIKTLVDVDENLFPERVGQMEEAQGSAPATEWDLRRALDDPDINAVAIAAPDHWHALATVWACQAGKHVYVEKPCCHNVWEGRKMVEAARRYDRMVAVGFQNRSIANVRAAMKFLHGGGLGDVYMARGLCFKPRESIGHRQNEPVPEGVHYDLWLGPAPQRPFNRNHFHYEWHWNWTYGSGDIGNQGPHQFDIARWGLNESVHPVRISSSGGYFKWDSDQQTPNTQTATFEYADGKILQFEVRGLYTNAEDGIRIGNLFFGTEGWMHVNGSTWKTYFGRKNEPGPSSESAEEFADPANLAGTGGGGHFANFIFALRSGDRNNLTSEIEQGFISTALPLLANIAYRTGAALSFDGAAEHFTGQLAPEANELLTRNYREPYVVPKQV
ncbi:MAG: Gfo/Idh/MocA family oxidoreductase [Phycisphaerales bacterium]|nr:MAG: Gfo/Idh/MocA family oxidoreductase [Phycisphaerales bacterium]